jgi:hypothetical protein
VGQSSAVLTADVTSSAVEAGATTASAAEKAETSTAPPTRGEQDDLCMADLRLTSDPQTTEAGGTRVEDDAERCLYVGPPWEEEVTTDRRNVDDFNEASRTIGCMLAVGSHVRVLQIFVPKSWHFARS